MTLLFVTGLYPFFPGSLLGYLVPLVQYTIIPVNGAYVGSVDFVLVLNGCDEAGHGGRDQVKRGVHVLSFLHIHHCQACTRNFCFGRGIIG